MNKPASTTSLSKDNLLSVLNQISNSNKYWLACSGGMDSCVLLHLFYLIKDEIKQDIEVLYVNHGLQEDADKWAIFCEKQCKDYDFNFSHLRVVEDCPKGRSVEEWAREKRYKLIEEVMGDNEVLFTAHHQDDQVETFFLQALRGAGPRGLASMPLIKKKEKIIHVRPLLDYSQEYLKSYAEYHKLIWQTDKSNSDCRYDRNYFRHKLAPLIEERWPAYRETIGRLINNQKEYKILLDEIASEDLKLAQHKSLNMLNLNAVQKLTAERQKNLMFFWLKEISLDIPGSRHAKKIISDIITSREDSSPCLNWANTEVRRYKNILYASELTVEHDIDIEYKWNLKEDLAVLNGILMAKSEYGVGISQKKVAGAEFIVRYRKGGEKIQPRNSSHTKTVKQLFQESSVLPWLRDTVPLIYINGELAAIPGFCIGERYSAGEDETSWNIHWSGYENVVQN